LAVPNVGEVQRPKRLFDVVDGCGGPEKLKYDPLPHFLFGWTVKEKVARRIFRRQAHWTHGRLKHLRHYEMQETAMWDAAQDVSIYHIALYGGKGQRPK
jgi:hypothetical protein